ncbi:MAG: hypothetical protein BWZ08_00576 [candidate division BRC1 bacterium ADurb.BinA292]|nr:MAG: hypothetical protein BWZ08_00576 [candidate division BRC1 bacterium ADurb.BinA292]
MVSQAVFAVVHRFEQPSGLQQVVFTRRRRLRQRRHDAAELVVEREQDRAGDGEIAQPLPHLAVRHLAPGRRIGRLERLDPIFRFPRRLVQLGIHFGQARLMVRQHDDERRLLDQAGNALMKSTRHHQVLLNPGQDALRDLHGLGILVALVEEHHRRFLRDPLVIRRRIARHVAVQPDPLVRFHRILQNPLEGAPAALEILRFAADLGQLFEEPGVEQLAARVIDLHLARLGIDAERPAAIFLLQRAQRRGDLQRGVQISRLVRHGVKPEKGQSHVGALVDLDAPFNGLDRSVGAIGARAHRHVGQGPVGGRAVGDVPVGERARLVQNVVVARIKVMRHRTANIQRMIKGKFIERHPELIVGTHEH